MLNHCRFIIYFACLGLIPGHAPSALANSNFVSNPYSPYPPSCVRMPLSTTTAVADTGAVKFHESTLYLPDERTFEQVKFTFRAYRSPCSEAGRSLVWVEYHMSEQEAKRKTTHVMLPVAVADYPGPGYTRSSIMSHAIEPNSWGADSLVDRERQMLLSFPHGSQDSTGYSDYLHQSHSWWFLLDVESPLEDDGYNIPYLMPIEAYNSRFTLRLRYPPDFNILSIEVPATADINFPAPPDFPFTGRLSGNWVVEGAKDQGFMLAISALDVGDQQAIQFPPQAMVLFFSHYTFDRFGKMLWLTGSAQFTPGTSEVSMPIDEVKQGKFRGSQAAQRRTIGQVTLTANNCNDITLKYDYGALGLGNGTHRLQRLLSLETAGYDCRDYAARVQANQ